MKVSGPFGFVTDKAGNQWATCGPGGIILLNVKPQAFYGAGNTASNGTGAILQMAPATFFLFNVSGFAVNSGPGTIGVLSSTPTMQLPFVYATFSTDVIQPVGYFASVVWSKGALQDPPPDGVTITLETDCYLCYRVASVPGATTLVGTAPTIALQVLRFSDLLVP